MIWNMLDMVIFEFQFTFKKILIFRKLNFKKAYIGCQVFKNLRTIYAL